MKLGMHEIVLKNKYSLEEALRKAKELNYDGYEPDILEFEDASEGKRDLIKRVSSEVNLEICSVCLGILWKYSLGSQNKEERDKGIEIVKNAIDFASFLGAEVILVPVPQPKDLSPEEARTNLVESLKSCTEKAESRKVILGVENVSQKLALNADNLIEITNRVNSSSCGVYYDVGNCTAIGLDASDELTKLGNKIAQVHVKDIIPGAERGRRVVPLGKGKIDFAKVLETIRKIKYYKYLVLEVSPQDINKTDEEATYSRETLKKLGFF